VTIRERYRELLEAESELDDSAVDAASGTESGASA
jgi:transcription initiation factor TFIIB